MASPTVASPSRALTDTTAPSPASPPRRLASAPPGGVDAYAVSSPLSARSGDGDVSSPMLAIKSEEYRLMFRLPSDEVLVQDFNCALQENILLQGHMYLFLHHICFYSNIFGYETKKTIALQEVTDVRKAKTAAIFPNAIEIVAGAKRHFFGSFLARDDAYRVIVDGWEQHVSDARLLSERQDAKSASSSDENGYVLLDEGKESKQDEDSSPLNRSSSPTAVMSGNTDSGDSDINTSKRFLEVPEDGTEEIAASLNPFSLEPFDDNAPNVPESYTLIAESKFQVPVEVLFDLLFSDGALGFLDDLHKKCGDKEFSCSKWRLDEQGGIVRDVSFLHPIKIYLGAKFGSCQEVQKLRIYKNSHVVIQTSQEIGDAPYGDHFIVEGIWDVEQDSLDENSCCLRIYINVAFSKRTIFRGKIEQSTKDECREVFGLWIKLGHDILKQDSSSRLKGASTSTNTDVQTEPTLNIENPTENTVTYMASAPQDSGLSTLVPPIERHHQSIERGSTSQELWGSIVSYMRSSQYGPVLAVFLVAIIILMQVTIIVVLTRSPKVLMVSPEASASSFASYSKDSMEWVQKRVSLLSEEMQMAEAHMEKMRHEFAWLKSHIERLERLRSRS
ncbi:protein VASCULAR ASSOCIATED DEATH 1, chloroplastic isoform X1 [Lolium rigidum]|uniref:protein VASCULAR ASSOCIATED DEATH 1, chloroplastic isoform X1 n=1 Tax=Lolium rigidum TaxID=89674 RepID=UPI001F5DEAAA|nr:protein VASCULAR ASSOCIATED DEATH 1, chloroplastic isoform X1 [Lolium rigidum]